MGAAASRTRVAWAAGLLQPRDGPRDADTGTFEHDRDPGEYADIHHEGDERDRHDCRLGRERRRGWQRGTGNNLRDDRHVHRASELAGPGNLENRRNQPR